ncbi:MAG: DUF6516 family protein [bacterium]|nr:DUF6516 family protein [bacterium]
MPAISFPDYASHIADILDRITTSGEAVLLNHQVDQRSASLGFIAGTLQFEDGSTLHFREFVSTGLHHPRMMYAYHYQDAGSNLIFRYDNAAHKPPLPQPEHKHTQPHRDFSGSNVAGNYRSHSQQTEVIYWYPQKDPQCPLTSKTP